jgi:RNA polymerase sigma-70 factor (ECF subfamily)
MHIIRNNEISDNLILKYILQEDTKNQGFRLLMEKYQEILYRQIRRIVGSHQNTDDVLQNTLIKVYKHIANFKGDSKLYSWMYRIATNESITFLKKEQKNKHLTLSQEEYQLKAHTYFDEEKGRTLLAEAIATLPKKQRIVFNKRYYDEMSYQDISMELTTSIGGLKASFHHAVKKVEAYLKDNLE